MRKFLSRFLYISLPILIVAITVEIALRTIPNDYKLKRNYLDNNASSIETLILGSSHSFRGVNPEHFSGQTFNAAYVSQSLNYDYEILKKYEGSFENLGAIILPISYFTFYWNIEDGIESWRVKNYVLYFEMEVAQSLEDYSEVLTMHPRENLKRLVSYYLMRESNITCSYLGWSGIVRKKSDLSREEAGKETAESHTYNDILSEENQKTFVDNSQILELIVKWCEERDIQILLFTPPAHKTYRMHLKDPQLKNSVGRAQEMASKYENCDYINLIDDLNFVEEDYFDPDHLAPSGARKLSAILEERLK